MKRLIVCVPGLDGSTTSWNPLLQRLSDEQPFHDATFLRFDSNYSLFSSGYARSLASELAAMVSGEWENKKEEGQEYEDVCFMAHSVGALLARRAYLQALGRDESRAPEEWAKKVSRIVLFAGINRGLCSSDNIREGKTPYKLRRALTRAAIEFLENLPFHFLLEDILAGSDLVTDVRLSWLRTFADLENPPTVVQVLGTRDKIVTAADSIDVEQFPTGHRIDIEEADHGTVVEVESENGFNPRRYALIKKALIHKFDSTPVHTRPTGPSDTVVFVLHGIRSSNTTWVAQATQLLEHSLPKARIVPATYWYFSALHFFLPMVRKRRTRWFQETYSYYLSRDPRANFHFIGHSNGTYLLGYALKNVPDMRFGRVILAGSVLPRDFPWRNFLGTDKQVKAVWNHRSQRDVPVAVLCAALRGLLMSDVGTGGYDGFEAIPEIHECMYHPGGHDAPVMESSLCSLIKGITEEDTPLCEPLAKQLEWFSRISRLAFVIPYLLLATLAVTAVAVGPAASRWASEWIQLSVLQCRLLIFASFLFFLALALNFI